MKDIANSLGVSVITVSKVLRNHSDISLATKKRVMRQIKELNYQPNWAARSLVTGRTYSIGLVVPDLVHPFFAEVAKGVARKVRPRGYCLIIASSEESSESEKLQITYLLARQVDALLIASTRYSPEEFRDLEAQNIPFILVDRSIPDLKANYVGVDDEKLGMLATGHLIENGCTRIAHIRGPEISTGIGRLKGYRAAMARHGLTTPPEYVVARDSSDDSADESGYRAMRQLLRAKPRPDGVFCYNDPTAIGAMRAIFEAGLRVPEDIAIIGAGNDRYASELRVPLTSIDQGHRHIGERAAQLALNLMSAEDRAKPKSILLPVQLVVRESSQYRRKVIAPHA